MRLLILILVALFASVGIAQLLKEDPGYVLISAGQWTIETTVAAAIVFLLVAFVVLYYAVRFLMGLLRMPAATRAANKRRQARNALRLLAKGSKAAHEGRWAAAEIALSKGAENAELPALYYSKAAQAAQHLNADWRRDNYLRRAADQPQQDSALLAGLTRAEMLLENDKAAEARAVLQDLRKTYPRHSRVLELLAGADQRLGEWTELRGILNQLRQQNYLPEPTQRALEAQTYAGLLAQASSRGDIDAMRTLWQESPLPVRSDENLLIAYAGYLRDNDVTGDAEALLRNALRERWSDKLVIGYGQLGRGNASTQLSTAEGWLEKHSQDSPLLLTLGRLAKRNRQLQKARGYLEKSLKIQASPDAYEELGEVLEELGEKEAARLCYRAALRMLSGKPEEQEGEQLLADKPVSLQEQKDATLLPAAEEKPASLEKQAPAETAEPETASKQETTAKQKTADVEKTAAKQEAAVAEEAAKQKTAATEETPSKQEATPAQPVS